MTPALLADLVRAAASDVLTRRGLDLAALPTDVGVERPRNPEHGDYATNVALRTAKKAGVAPRDLAGWLVEELTGKDGIARFTTIYPGWYRGRTVHIHAKVHIDKKNVLTTQLYFDEDVSDNVNTLEPYSSHTGRDTFNDGDSIFDESGLLTIESKPDDTYVGVLNLGLNA